MKKGELLRRIETLEGELLALTERVDILNKDLHQSRNPYKLGSPEWQKHAKEVVKNIHIYT